MAAERAAESFTRMLHAIDARDWTGMRHGVLWSVLYTVVLVGIAYRHFRRKDILS